MLFTPDACAPSDSSRSGDMSGSRSQFSYVLALLLYIVLIVDVRPALAYVDPGAGSMMLQALLGGVAGLAVIGRLGWHRVKQMLRGWNPDKDSDSEESTPHSRR
jgi:hypothetical protein